MKKNKIFTASLASIAVLGASFLSSQHFVVKADTVEATNVNDANHSNQEKEDLINALDKLRSETIKKIDANDKILDKDRAIQEVDAIMAVAKNEIRNDSFSLDEFVNKLDVLGNPTNSTNQTSPVRASAEVVSSGDKEAMNTADKDEEYNRVNVSPFLNRSELPATSRTEWVLETSDGSTVAMVVDREKVDRTFSNYDDAMKTDGFTFKRTVTDGTVTRHIYTTTAKTIEETEWVDEDGNILFEAKDGLKDENYNSYNDILVKRGYKLIDILDDDRFFDHDSYSKVVRGFLYKKVGNPSETVVNTGTVATNGETNHNHSEVLSADIPAPTPAVPATPNAPERTASTKPTAETPATPSVAPAVAGTSQDNTYQAPAAKSEDKKELPNTGGKDNVAVASLGFLGLLLGALPFVKRKN